MDLINKRDLHMVTDYLAEVGTIHTKGRLRSPISLQEVGPENWQIVIGTQHKNPGESGYWFTFLTEWSRVTQT